MSSGTTFKQRLAWQTTRSIEVCGITIPVSEALAVSRSGDAGWDSYVAGIRPNSKPKSAMKSLIWPILRASENVLGHQFLQYTLARWIRRYANERTAFLECGPGDMSLRRFLPPAIAYNAIEFGLSEFQVRRVLARDPRVNLVLGSIESIPLADSCVDMVACVEMLQHVPDVEKGLREIARVCKPGAKVMVTVANGHCVKVKRKGANKHFVHLFTEAAFRGHAKRAGLKVLEHEQTGKWVPVPQKLIGGHSMHLPIRSAREEDNCYFVYLFEVQK
ncbi:MAG: class I SAM-dependent methyltransferase [Phycisphaeraceae bacterium]|nr:class I SAM-dependent methyltransferase [Phycisphaeraceae bacterium]